MTAGPRSLARAALGAILVVLLVPPAPTLAREPAPAARARDVLPRGSLGPEERRHVEVFRGASPSVVHINTVQLARRLFSPTVTEVPRGSGTGFVWDKNGHVVTNFHVLAGSNAATVTLSDQSVWEASLVGWFPDRDLAVLHIDAPPERLRPIDIGTSRDLQVGQRVYAIGNPFGLDQTLTTGIVSALEREIPSNNERKIRGVIQTDAAINPGNSGGPLLDSAGRLVGVNTAIYSPSGASAGIGFAIPVDEVNRIVPRLIRDGRFVRPVLGVEAAPPGFLAALGQEPGLAIIDVQRDGPADRAGLRPFRRSADGRVIIGDVITSLAGRPVKTLDDLYDVLERHEAGFQVKMRVRRGPAEVEVPVVLGKGD